MQVRFDCPVCHQSHVLDMPETTIHMTCSRTGAHLELRLGKGGDVKATVVGPDREQDAETAGGAA